VKVDLVAKGPMKGPVKRAILCGNDRLSYVYFMVSELRRSGDRSDARAKLGREVGFCLSQETLIGVHDGGLGLCNELL
jgi:hypothetical protein